MVKEENECKIIFNIFLVHKNIGKEKKKESKKERKKEITKERTKQRKKERKKVHKIILCIHTVFVYHGLGIILHFTVYRLYRFYR